MKWYSTPIQPHATEPFPELATSKRQKDTTDKSSCYLRNGSVTNHSYCFPSHTNMFPSKKPLAYSSTVAILPVSLACCFLSIYSIRSNCEVFVLFNHTLNTGTCPQYETWRPPKKAANTIKYMTTILLTSCFFLGLQVSYINIRLQCWQKTAFKSEYIYKSKLILDI